MVKASDDDSVRDQFWLLPLRSLNAVEWELLCDHCGRCCLKKLQDDETEEIVWTRIVCRFHDASSARCNCYGTRSEQVPECLEVHSMTDDQLHWMPDTCAYRLRMENKPLFPWHPLLAGSSDAMTEAQISIKGKTLSEDHVHEDGYDEHIIRWVES